MTTFVPLTRGMRAFVDDEDAARVLALHWQAERREGGWLALANLPAGSSRTLLGRRGCVTLHRFVVEATARARVSVVDGDRLNCRRANLVYPAVQVGRGAGRVVDPNPYVGVRRYRDRFRAVLYQDGEPVVLCCCASAEAAALTREVEIRRRRVARAALNFPLLAMREVTDRLAALA